MGVRGLHRGMVIGLVLISSLRISTPAPSWAGPADQEDANIIVQFTSPAAGDPLSGPVSVQGFAGDRRSTRGSGITENDMQLYLDAPPGQVDPRSLFAVPGSFRNGELTEQDPSCCHPELAAALAFRSPWSTCTFPPGRHTLTAWVSSSVVPGARNRADVDAEVEACAPGKLLTRNDLSSAGNRLRLDQPGPFLAGQPAAVSAIRANFAAGLDARCSTTEVDCLYYIQFRDVPGPRARQGSQQGNSSYVFSVSPANGTFGLLYWPPGDEPDRFVRLVPVTPAAAIH